MKDKRHYALIGRLLVKNRPEIAASLLSVYETTEKDYSKLPKYLRQFCGFKNIKNSESIHHRREFLCAMLHLYSPEVFTQPSDSIKVKHGFTLKISVLLRQDPGNTSRMIREVIGLEKIYDTFRYDVTRTLEHLTVKQN